MAEVGWSLSRHAWAVLALFAAGLAGAALWLPLDDDRYAVVIGAIAGLVAVTAVLDHRGAILEIVTDEAPARGGRGARPARPRGLLIAPGLPPRSERAGGQET